MSYLLWILGEVTGLNSLMSTLTAFLSVPLLLYGTATCLFGYKLFKIQLALSGFTIGALTGILCGVPVSGGFAALLALALGILGAWAALKLYVIGVFLTVTSVSFLALLGVITCFGGIDSTTITVSLLAGIAAGVLGVLLGKTIIISFTAITGGLLSGAAIGRMSGAPSIGLLAGVAFCILGIWMQHRLEEKDTPHASATTQAPKTKNDAGRVLHSAAKELRTPPIRLPFFAESAASQLGKVPSGQMALTTTTGRFWTDGLPLLVVEYQITSKEGVENQVFFNIRVQNLSQVPIVGFYFSLSCFDPLKREIESVSAASFLDLDIKPGAYWYSNNSLALPNSTTRKCVVTINNVVSKNEEIWENPNNAPLRELPSAKSLEIPLDLLEEYYTEISEKSHLSNVSNRFRFAPSQEDGYWVCSCGQINCSRICVACGLEEEFILKIYNAAWLRNQKELRIAEMERLEEERRQYMETRTEALRETTADASQRGKETSREALNQLEHGKQHAILAGATVLGVVSELLRKAKNSSIAALNKARHNKKQTILVGVSVGAVAIAFLFYLPYKLPETAISSSVACNRVIRQIQSDLGPLPDITVTGSAQLPVAHPKLGLLELTYTGVLCDYDVSVNGYTFTLLSESDFTTGLLPGSVKQIEFQDFEYPAGLLNIAYSTQPTAELPTPAPAQPETPASYTPIPQYFLGEWYNSQGDQYVLDDLCYLISFTGDGITSDLNGEFVRRGSDQRHSLRIPSAEPGRVYIDGVSFSSEKPQDAYILPDSNQRYLTEADLDSLTHRECCLARNEIYARHGRIFTTKAIADYFEEKNWYRGTIEPQAFDRNTISYFNNYEMENVKLLQQYETEKFGRSYY